MQLLSGARTGESQRALPLKNLQLLWSVLFSGTAHALHPIALHLLDPNPVLAWRCKGALAACSMPAWATRTQIATTMAMPRLTMVEREVPVHARDGRLVTNISPKF